MTTLEPELKEYLNNPILSLDEFFRVADELIDKVIIDPQDLSMLAYMAPEHSRRLNIALDHRSNFYSIGVIFYKLLTGSLPFKESEPEALLHEKLTIQPVSPHHLNSSIPKALSDIILKLLSQKPEERYQSTIGLKQDLLHCTTSNFSLGKFDYHPIFKMPEKLYGREKELKQLQEILNRIDPFGVEILMVYGYSGIGKTTMIHALEQELTARGGYFSMGKFNQQKKNIAYSGLGDLFGHLIKQILSEGDKSISQWREKLLPLLGDNAQVIIDIVPELKVLIGEQPMLMEMGPSEAKNRFDYTFQKFVNVFSNPKHPLALFLDDLQWADLASLDALRLILDNNGERALLFLGAYRDNEVDSIHPLNILLEEAQQRQINVHEMRLMPLKINEIAHWIGDAVHYHNHDVIEVAHWVHEKTGGNPFYIKLFLHILYEDGFIFLNKENNAWIFNISEIKSLPATENVGDMMSRRLSGLSQELQYILQVAACFGNRFDEDILGCVVTEDKNKLENKLLFLTSLGLLFKNENHYQFVHDQVQTAALKLLNENDKQLIHVRIGKAFLEILSTEDREKLIVTVVEHLNQGKTFLNRNEQIELINLNVRASARSKGSIAYQAAFEYLDGCKNIIDEDIQYFWREQPNLTFDFFYSYADVLFLLRKLEMGEFYCQLILNNIKLDFDKNKIYLLRIKHYVNHGKLNEAIKEGIFALGELGVYIPENPSIVRILITVWRVRLLMGKAVREKDINHLVSENPLNEIIMQIFMEMIPATHDVGNFKLTTLFSAHASGYCLKNGLSFSSSYALLVYSGVFYYIFKKPKLGYQFSKFAFKVNEYYDNKLLRGRLDLLFSVFMGIWSIPAKDCFAMLDSSVKRTLESSDFFYYSSSRLFGTFFMINKSNYNYAEIRERHDLIMKEGFIKFIDLDGELFLFIVHFSDYLNQFKRIISKKRIKAINNTSLIFYHTIKAMSCYHGGCYKKSFLQAYQIKNIIKECVGNPLVIFYYFYFFLSSLELFKRSSFYKKPYYLWKIWSVYKELNFWNKTCPENFSYYVYIMKAGFLDIVGLYKLASKKYDQAIAISKQDQFLLDEALANELAAKFHLENDQEKIASSYMAEARNLYQRWGADAKIKFLEARYPDLLHPIMKENKNSSLNDLIENMLSTQNVISLENESLFESNQKAQQRIQQHQTEIAHYARVNTLSELATGLAHEINQPLASSLNYLGGCLERLKSSETSPDIIAGVEKASTGIERAGEIIQHLRASIKKQDITKTMINLNEVINHVLPLLNYKIKSSQTELTLNLSNTLPNVLADKLQIEQVLINLINNALEALQEVNINKRKLIITTQQNQSHIEIKIKDTGKGIDPNIQEKLFQPFMTTKPEGLGMGLAICKTIIETYSGHIQAQRLEDGTELSVVIPVPSYSPNS